MSAPPVERSPVTVLVPGPMNARVVERLEAAFTLLRLPHPDPDLVTPELAERVRGVASSSASPAFLDALPRLEIVGNFGVGYDGVDAHHAARRNIVVTNTPDVLTEEVADTALGLLLATLRELPRAERWLREGRWATQGPYPLTPGTLRGRTVGVFGMGRIGQAIARRLVAFGVPVLYHNRKPVPGAPYRYAPTLLELAQSVDTLVSVAPATPETLGAVNAAVLAALGPTGVFVNIGRGTTADEPALIRALADRTILAAGLDVFADEPRVPQALLDLPNAVLLPHIGSASQATRNAMADLVADNLVSWFRDGRALTPVPETAHLARRA